ncbi:MAG: ATP-binding protein [Blastomonas sp.]
MAPDTDSPKSPDEDLTLKWSSRVSLTSRILAVNIFAIAILAGSFFYLDSYRTRIADERLEQARQSVWQIARAASRIDSPEREAMLLEIGKRNRTRLRIYNASGKLGFDSFAAAPPSYELRDPDSEPWRRHAARFLDRGIDFVVRAPDVEQFSEPAKDVLDAWPEAVTAASSNQPTATFRYADDRTPVVSAAARISRNQGTILMTYNARDITRIVRAERFNLSIIILITTLVSVLLSLFLARTIVRPLRRLASAAMRVRLGRAREVVVPRLPSRRDEIGLLARSLSDMSMALRQKIDATEAFAADVSHEIKNPLASLRSALDGLKSVKDDNLREQLLDVACNDVLRLDRLITDISEASRVDAQLTRIKFESLDLGEMIENLLRSREAADLNRGCEIAFARPRKGVATISGEGTRIERVINNLLDNAVSFSPSGGIVQIFATRTGNVINIRVVDEGPGVPDSEREMIFRRFHSVRPEDESFGEHSGLGLAIARTIIEGHHGSITVRDRDDGQQGACFEILLPVARDDGADNATPAR